MSATRIVERSCDECTHKDICILKDNLSKLRQQTHDLEKLLEYKNFQIVTYCDYYQCFEPQIRRDKCMQKEIGT